MNSANEALDTGFIRFAITTPMKKRRGPEPAVELPPLPTIRRPSELDSSRDSEGSRIGQERIDLVGLERRVEGDLVDVLVGQVGSPYIDRPLFVRCPEAEPRAQQAVGSLEFAR